MADRKVWVKLKFFAHLADRYGAREEERELSAELEEALEELAETISSRLGGGLGSHYVVLINGRNLRDFEGGYRLKDGDHLAFVSIVGGG